MSQILRYQATRTIAGHALAPSTVGQPLRGLLAGLVEELVAARARPAATGPTADLSAPVPGLARRSRHRR